MSPFRTVGSDRTPDDIEREVLEWWRSERLFERTLEANREGPPFVFFDGPPTANGRPGIHHVFARTVKDLFCRHRAMHGYHVPRKAGWDTHGLPVEIEVEKALGIKGKPEIEKLGVEEFNRRCRESVWTYRAEWERLCERIAHWMDYDHPYVTYHNEYIESEWWALKTLYERDLLYRGHKILPYCARCGTSLSSHEVAQGYQDVEDPSIYVAMDLLPNASDDGIRRRIIVWTTTPWTLVSNVALAVHPTLEYLELKKKNAGGWTIILAEARAGAVLGADYADRWERVRSYTGTELAGRRYKRVLDWVPYPDGSRHEEIVAAEFVSAEDGSGVVHMAPAFGADDYAVGQQYGLAMLNPVTARGEFAAGTARVEGMWVKAADKVILAQLEHDGTLWKGGTFVHPYPHCWRCGTPLIYYARESWFVRTTAFKDEMLRRNASVDWHPPEVGTGRFGEWLSNNIDWAISRDRFWGTPLPVWVCSINREHTMAIGSFAELSERAGKALGEEFDPHKPFIDAWTWPCACGGTMSRVGEVIDAWFDSGAMPFAQWHYPFENREHVAREYPADFIAEGLDQTRGWFYSLLAIAAGLGDALPNNAGGGETADGRGRAAPYRSVVVNDLVLDANGVKMSKRLGNVVNPFEVVEKFGADAVRLFLLTSSQLGVPKRFDEGIIRDTATGFLVTLRNVYSGIFAQYANFGWSPSSPTPAVASRPIMDRWILSRLTSTERAVDEALWAFDATTASRTLMSFLVDDVSNWYVRQSRSRFYEVDGADNQAAFATLYAVLVSVCQMLAPLAPYLSDWMHRELTGSSVHLASLKGREGIRDEALEAAMAEVRELARLGRAAREEAGLNVRRPLARGVCVVPAALTTGVESLLSVLSAELNVKSVALLTTADALVTLEAKPNFKALGRRFGKSTPLAAAAIQRLSSAQLSALERGQQVAITVDGSEHGVLAEEVTVVRRATGDLLVKEAAGRFVALDLHQTPELRREGIARELVSRIQRMRKDEGLEVSDRVKIWIWGDSEIENAVAEYIDWMAGEVLARDVQVKESPADVKLATIAVDVDGLQVSVALTVDR